MAAELGREFCGSSWHTDGTGEFFLVIAANPAAVQAKYGLTKALGPWLGALSGDGETVRLLNASGAAVDQVDFGRGFPWPTVGDAPGYSMELIHPALDNSLGGNWRSSVVGGAIQEHREVIVPRSTWRYRKGTSAASTPATAWRHPNFDDSAWSLGKLPIGYDPDIQFGTGLSDMRVDGVSAYVTVFLRTRFNLTQATQVHQLKLEALYDDGFKLWVNGQLLLNHKMSPGEVSFQGDAETTRESNNYETFDVDVPEGVLRDGENLICVQLANGNQGNSSDCFFDCRLKAVIGPTGRGPTPGRTNHASFDPRRAWTYEIEPLWELTFAAAEANAMTVSIPSGLVRPGRLYRARVRHVDDQNRASNWSDPVEFTATAADNTAALVTNLRLTELMYHPEDRGYEFVELFNLGLDGVLDLSGARFTTGIDYTFPDDIWLRSGEYLILAKTAETNFPAFRSYHELPHDLFIHGPYDGSLNNAGETLTLRTRVGGVPIFSFTWSDSPTGPTIADGGGFSLVPLATSQPSQSTTNINLASNWRTSLEMKGSPGREDAIVSMLRLRLISIEADALQLEVTVPSGMRFRLEGTSDFTRWSPISEGSSSGAIRVPFGVGETTLFVRAIQLR